jgi:hypothetical protein
MKKVFIILIVAFITIACNGQATLDAQRKEAIEAFKKQKHRFEIKGYKIYYNDTLLKLEKRDVFYKKLGNPFYDGDVAVWNSLPIWGRCYSTMERFFIYFRPFAEGREELSDLNPFYYAAKRMPVIDGYMLVEGHPIHKDTTPKELSEILAPIYGDNFGNLMGTPTIVFELKEDQIKEIIPHWGADKAYNNIFIGFDYLKDEKTKKIIGLKSVDYYNFMM